MCDAFDELWRVHTEAKLPLRTAAYVVGLKSIARAHLTRGFD